MKQASKSFRRVWQSVGQSIREAKEYSRTLNSIEVEKPEMKRFNKLLKSIKNSDTRWTILRDTSIGVSSGLRLEDAAAYAVKRIIRDGDEY